MEMKANKIFRISEIIWLVMAIACVGTDLYIFLILRDNERGLFFLGMTAMSSIMYYVRRRMRVRADIALKGQSPDSKNQ
jgi:hypothetical protein